MSVAAAPPAGKSEADRAKEPAARKIPDPAYTPEPGDEAVLYTVVTRRGAPPRPAPTACGAAVADYLDYLKWTGATDHAPPEAIRQREVKKLTDAGRLFMLESGAPVRVVSVPATVTVQNKPPVTYRLLEVQPLEGPNREKSLYLIESRVKRLIPAPIASSDGRVDSLLRGAQNLEKAGKIAGALEHYRRIVKDFPDAPQAKTAEARIQALAGK